MSFIEKIQHKDFWMALAKVFIPFFIFLTLISLFMNSWRDIFAGDFQAVNQLNFSDGKWVRFFGIKIVITFLYSLWMTNKNYK